MRRAYGLLCLLLFGCDPTAGLADSADAALPGIKRYFDGRGSQLAEGPWNRVVLDLDADTQYHVGGRRLDDDEPTFHLFGADVREGCQVAPNAGTWLMGKAPGAPFRLLPYLESMDERGRGRLRFTTLDCAVQDLAIEDAGRPYPRLYEHGYLVPTKNGYTFADPWRGEARSLVDDVQSELLWGSQTLLWADGALQSFSDQFERGSRWGSGVVSVVQLPESYLVEDADGLHQVLFDGVSLAITGRPVLPEACHLQRATFPTGNRDVIYVSVQQPCGSPNPSILKLDRDTFEVLDRAELPLEIDARNVRPILPAQPMADELPPPVFAYLTDVEDDGLGTVWVWRGDDSEPVRLGERGQLESIVIESTGDWDGRAQIQYQTLGGLPARDWVRFRWDGATELTAERVVRNSVTGELLVDFDGVAGNLPSFLTPDSYRVLITGVPGNSGRATSFVGDRQFARVAEFDGDAGRLLLGTEPNQPDSWGTLAQGVPPEHARFAWFMPALVFLEDWDAKRGTGRLVAYNYELDARSTISEGVSSFDLTSYPWDGVVYAVPAGKQRGLWFSKAK